MLTCYGVVIFINFTITILSHSYLYQRTTSESIELHLTLSLRNFSP